MHIKKRTVYTVLLIIILFGLWVAWRAHTTPPYEVITEKPIFGNSASTVTVLEFSDLQCPACKAANPAITQLKQAYKDRIQFTYMHFPLANLHQYAQQAAEAAECASDHGKFYEFIDEAFLISPDLTRSNLISIAATLQIPSSNFTSCLNSGWKANFVAMDVREGLQRGVQGTPTIFINGERTPDWEYGTLSHMVDLALNQTLS